MNKSNLLITIVLGILICTTGCGNNTQEVPTDTDMLALIDAKLKKAPKDAALHYERALELMKRDRINDAINSANVAIKYDDDNVDYYILLADLHLRNGDLKTSYADLQQALELEPNSVEVYSKLGEISFLSKDYDRATDNINKVIEMDPNNVKAYFMMGFLYKETGDSTNAVRNFRKAIEIDPEYADAYEELGLMYAGKKNKLGVEYLITAVNLRPNNTIARYALALLYQDLENYNAAVEEYNKILIIDSVNVNALNNLGYINLLNANYDEAINFFDKAIMQNPYFVEAVDNKGYAYELKGDYAKAEECYKAALEIDVNYENSKKGLTRIGK
ncbi:MAG: tetratricopeptide repeat protein [Bacteroidales bacterium]|nr:tetratricopeptide repeat protein [Bacteroidales bacterium]